MFSSLLIVFSFQLLLVDAFNIKSLHKGNSLNSVLFYPGKFNTQLPSELYSSFLTYVNKNDINVFISQDKENNSKVISNELKDFKKCIVSHSFSANDAIEFFSECDSIDKLILIDPLDDKFIKVNMPSIEMPSVEVPGFDMPKFEIQKMWDNIENSIDIDKLDNKIDDIYKIKDIVGNTCVDCDKDPCECDLDIDTDVDADKIVELKEKKVLIIRTSESNRWRVFPSVPPIGILNLKDDKIKFQNKNVITINKYGHFDILDKTWSDLANKFFSKGADDRSLENMDTYHNSVSKSINTFLNSD